MTSLELVVARYAEDLSWLRRVPKTVRVTVYNKGGDTVPGMALPNVGREAHTYLHHMVTRYDDLAEVTLFCQGKPFDHVPDLHKILRQLAAGMGSGGTASGRPNPDTPLRAGRARSLPRLWRGVSSRNQARGLWL